MEIFSIISGTSEYDFGTHFRFITININKIHLFMIQINLLHFISRALSSGSGFIKLNGYHSESNVAKDGVELNSTHMNLSSACCSANRDLKEMFLTLLLIGQFFISSLQLAGQRSHGD